MKLLKEPLKFQWDEGNIEKNSKHKVGDKEAEESFFDRKKKVYKDILHSEREEGCILIGKTKRGKLLYTVFTIRGKKVRVISSRSINKKEVQMYEKKSLIFQNSKMKMKNEISGGI